MDKITPDALNIAPGDHVLAIVTGEEDARLIGEYVAECVRQEEPCSVIASSDKLGTFESTVAQGGVDIDDARRRNQLSFVDPVSVGQQDGRFDMEAFVERMRGAFADAASGGVEHMHNCGAMGWLHEVTDDMDDAVYLEAHLDQLYEGQPLSGL